jgi:hypothetical protein
MGVSSGAGVRGERGVFLGRIRAARGGDRRSWGRGVLAPSRSMVQAPGPFTRWRTPVRSACGAASAHTCDGSRRLVFDEKARWEKQAWTDERR